MKTKVKDNPTKVIFRKYDNGQIVALFPELPGTNDCDTCSCYEHLGQHGSADIKHLIYITEPANEAEYKSLKNELINQAGYDLKVIKRASKAMFTERVDRM